MGDAVDDTIELHPKDRGGPADNVITDQPMRLRWGLWRTGHVLQVGLQAAAQYEDFRTECHTSGQDPSGRMPPHFTLDADLRDTAMALLRFQDDPSAQEDVCYLCALMEALVHTPCAILRTDLIRRVYREVESLGKKLSLRWQAGDGHFLLPINEDAGDPNQFRRRVAPLDDLKAFFATLRALAQERYQKLATQYVFYFPRIRPL